MIATAALTLAGLTLARCANAVTVPIGPRQSTSSNSSVPYFDWETQQLSDAQLAAAFAPTVAPAAAKGGQQCKVFPGDAAWPSDAVWSNFNASVGGALIKTVPLAAPCYKNWPQYDPVKCAQVTANWHDPHLHVSDPTSTDWPLFQGRTCLPPAEDPLGLSGNCTLGGFAAYSVGVTTVAQIQTTLAFVQKYNIRLNVRNTGHDFADKGLGAGALSIWTHKLNTLQYLPSYGPAGNGPAYKLGSGVLTEDVYKSAEANGITAIGGECRTVGVAGGYTAGGGHSPLSSVVGMAADQILSLEVVLPCGKFVTVDATHNPDLYWALRGGGGGTFGVVTSVVMKAYPKVIVTTMTFSFGTSATVSADTFWAGIRAFFTYYTTFVDAGTYSYFLVENTGTNSFQFVFDPFWGLNHTIPQLKTLVTPFLNDLAKLGISVTPEYTQYSSFWPAWNASFPPENVGGYTNHAGGRLFPRENFVDQSKLNATLGAVRYAISAGGLLVGYNIKAGVNPSVNQSNSVNPAWRKTVTHFILPAIWDQNATIAQIQAASKTLTTDWGAKWRAVSPGAGAYMAEADINEPNFQQSFFGSNYDRLYSLKQQYDPNGLFYTPTGVGSEDWVVTGQVQWIPTQNGRLCRA
ncbi:isoamyl alcohol oxidase-like protein [Thozetella sp. PMI_491]|nr:isoamyl alcohol oxidase-like protein [Thozetella sp. PMI_491]